MNELYVIPIKEEDSFDVWTWRNDSLTRSMSVESDPVSWEKHTSWFSRSLTDPHRILLLGVFAENKVGVCRFDISSDFKSAEVSINLNPDMRGKKLSTILLRKGMEYFWKQKTLPLTAVIKPQNVASIRCFTFCGFEIARLEGPLQHYKIDPPTS
jgi:UDP-2,4-diacetamido-2,4,6-trideoxy-beta-L-altropyranose hydrolase